MASLTSETAIGIYCDLGKSRGAGHFMRSVSLGAELVRQGAIVTLVGAISELSWGPEIASSYGIDTVDCKHTEDLAALVSRLGWDGLILDSYAVNANDLAGIDLPIAAIDDEALRPLPAHVVFNPNLTGFGLGYGDWPTHRVLRGPAFAPIRPELAASRPATYRERGWQGRQQRVLVMCGGTDPYGAATPLTQRVLDTLAPTDVRVLATGKPLADLKLSSGSTVTTLTPTPAIAPLIDWADLVVTTAGSTVWELCCLGAPMALVVVADNQREHCQAALEAGIAVGLGTLPELTAAPVLPHAVTLRTPADLNRLGRRAFETVDGRGAQRVAEAVLPLVQQIAVRRATEADSATMFAWRNDPATRAASRNTAAVSWERHQQWLASVLNDKARELLIVEHLGEPVAVLRFDQAADVRQGRPPEWEISMNLAPERRGHGLAAPAFRAGHAWLRQQLPQRDGSGAIAAEIRVGNQAILAILQRCGYVETSRDDEWAQLRYEL
ncbi:MAG: GNAT family N-acetyltransferase [Mycobacteriales bacterium]